MSRQHLVNFVCDRCGKAESRPGKSDGNFPPGWDTAEGMDLCAEDIKVWKEGYTSFVRAFRNEVLTMLALPDLSELTPRGRRVMDLAIDEARRLGHNYIGTEHLLLGLVREGEGIAAGVLESQGVSLDKTRNAIEFIVGKGKASAIEDQLEEMDPETHPEADDD